MTAGDAVRARIPRVRRPMWTTAYLRLPLMANKTAGPWAELYDDHVQVNALNIRPGSQRLPVFSLTETDYEPYTGPVSVYERDPKNFSRTYVES